MRIGILLVLINGIVDNIHIRISDPPSMKFPPASDVRRMRKALDITQAELA